MEQRSYDAFKLLLPVLRAKAAKSTILINGVLVGPDRRLVSGAEATAIKEGVEYLRNARRRLIEANKETEHKQTQPCNGAKKWIPNPQRRQQLQRQLQLQQQLESKATAEKQHMQRQLANKATPEKQQLEQKQQNIHSQACVVSPRYGQRQQQQQLSHVNDEKERQIQTQDEAEVQKLIAIKDNIDAKVEEAHLKNKELEDQIATQQNELQQLQKANDVALNLVLNATVMAIQKYQNECHNTDDEEDNCSLLIELFSFR